MLFNSASHSKRVLSLCSLIMETVVQHALTLTWTSKISPATISGWEQRFSSLWHVLSRHCKVGRNSLEISKWLVLSVCACSYVYVQMKVSFTKQMNKLYLFLQTHYKHFCLCTLLFNHFRRKIYLLKTWYARMDFSACFVVFIF